MSCRSAATTIFSGAPSDSAIVADCNMCLSMEMSSPYPPDPYRANNSNISSITLVKSRLQHWGGSLQFPMRNEKWHGSNTLTHATSRRIKTNRQPTTLTDDRQRTRIYDNRNKTTWAAVARYSNIFIRLKFYRLRNFTSQPYGFSTLGTRRNSI